MSRGDGQGGARARRAGAVAKVVSLLVTLAMLAGCATTHTAKIQELGRVRSEPRVLLMPLDVELAELTAGGVAEPNADWTRAALSHIESSLKREFEGRKTRLTPYAFDSSNVDENQVVRLTGVVGGTILLSQIAPGFALPSKRDYFDWSIGPEAASLGRRADADYALYIFVRDSYASAGRVAAVVVAALFGVGLPPAQQVGYALLVDLQSGNVVWFNRLFRPAGDLRTAEPAADTVRVLLAGFPK